MTAKRRKGKENKRKTGKTGKKEKRKRGKEEKEERGKEEKRKRGKEEKRKKDGRKLQQQLLDGLHGDRHVDWCFTNRLPILPATRAQSG